MADTLFDVAIGLARMVLGTVIMWVAFLLWLSNLVG